MLALKPTKPQLVKKTSLDHLSAVPDSSVWLANFTSEQTKKTYRNAITEFVNVMKIQSEDDWKTIKPAHAIAWRETMQRGEKSNRTIHTNLSALSSLFKHLCEKQVVRENPVRDVKRPQVATDQVESIVLTREQASKMLQAPPENTERGLRDQAILATLFYTGTRIQSVCTLKVKDIFEDNGFPVLAFTIKGGRKERIAINPLHQAAIKRYLAAADHGEDKESPMFLGNRRKNKKAPLTQRFVREMFNKYARQVGLSEKVTPHSARATFITEALNAGVPIEQVQHTVFHRNITTTKMYDKRRVTYKESATFRVHY